MNLKVFWLVQLLVINLTKQKRLCLIVNLFFLNSTMQSIFYAFAPFLLQVIWHIHALIEYF